MTMKALDYTITDEELQELCSDMKTSNTTHDLRAEILNITGATLEMHPMFKVNNVETTELGQGFREDELIAVMSAIDSLYKEVEDYSNMSRVDHLKAAVFGL